MPYIIANAFKGKGGNIPQEMYGKSYLTPPLLGKKAIPLSSQQECIDWVTGNWS
ncbi:hypothetical protein F7734_23750 [Scytonema sp. UIC 10036]|uniref:hypothetical protein n=1 Tax=Scytonema sp. UIC 10036 TaxID=2304196 RepID=UPI0012DAD767|nr:hypothetical protein [Scytonema sp. UIC 10036]MUG95208.1 hypothetical protein [Scytonema sp. UIC 10036]